MATDENNHKNEARDDWTGCTFRVERGPSSEGRAWGMADILADVRDMTNLERRLIDDDGAAPASHYLPSLLIATYAGATTVAPPGRAARERGRPALCANVLDEFVRALLPQLDSRRAGRPAGSTPLRVRTVFFKAVMFLLHCYPTSSSYYPACRFLFSPSAHKEFAVDLNWRTSIVSEGSS